MISRPSYGSMPLADALRADWRGWSLSRKMDGVFAVREFAGCHVTGEAMRDGRFYPFDIAVAFGADVRRLPWTERSEALNELLAKLPAKLNWHRIATGHGPEFIEAMIQAARNDNTPDLVVAKPMDAPFGADLVKVKIQETFDVTVADATGGSLSVAITLDGQPAGRCPVMDLAALESMTVGDVIEVGGTLTAKGKIREPVFLRRRFDKGARPDRKSDLAK